MSNDPNMLGLLLQLQRDLTNELRETRAHHNELRDALHAQALLTERLSGDMRELRAGLGNHQALRDDVVKLKQTSRWTGAVFGSVFGGVVAFVGRVMSQ